MFEFLLRILRPATKKPVIVIVGPTASGKSSLGIELAQKLDGEIISADSRQVYKNLELFSGATVGEETKEVPHYLVSAVSLGEQYNADRFTVEAKRLITEIHNKGKIPLVVGDTGFWVRSLMFPNGLPAVPSSPELRAELDKKSTEELLNDLKKADPRRAKTIDIKNRRRIMRALEVVAAVGKVPRISKRISQEYHWYFIYIRPDKEITADRIRQNVKNRFQKGIIKEALINIPQLSRSQAEELGQAYKHTFDYLNGNPEGWSEEQLQALYVQEEVYLAKKQKTYLNKLFAEIFSYKILITTTDKEEQTKEVVKVFKQLFRSFD